MPKRFMSSVVSRAAIHGGTTTMVSAGELHTPGLDYANLTPDLVTALGCGVGKDFDAGKLRYSRVFLLMDADSDGYHIATLLLTFFFRHLPQLIRGDPKAFQGQPRDIISPACPGSALGPLPGRTCPEHLTRKASRRHPVQMPEPPQLAPLDVEEQRPDTLRRKLVSAACTRDLVLSVITQSS